MVVKKGKVKITSVGNDVTTIVILNIVEKNDGNYTETLTEIVDNSVYAAGSLISGQSEFGLGYKVFPNTTVNERIAYYTQYSGDTIEWLEAFTEV